MSRSLLCQLFLSFSPPASRHAICACLLCGTYICTTQDSDLYICPACFFSCKQAFGDSVPNTPREHTEELCKEERDENLSGFIGIDEACVFNGFVEIWDEVFVHCEPFDELSFVALTTDYCGWHAFGTTTADFQVLCEMSAWDLPEGIVVFNSDVGKSLVFQSGLPHSSLGLWSAIYYLRKRQAVGIIMHYAPEGGYFFFTLVEVHQYIGQSVKTPHTRAVLTDCIRSSPAYAEC